LVTHLKGRVWDEVVFVQIVAGLDAEDINKDGVVDSQDLQMVINKMLNK